MSEEFLVHPIAYIHSDFPEKFGIPRQSGIVEELQATIVFEPDYRNTDAVRGLEQYSHIWLLWRFSECADKPFTPTVRPPRLGGNTRMGVFATRSPFRPNSIGLSCVRLEKMDLTSPNTPVLHIAGADLMDGTPILDIKPYLPYTDSIPTASGGFALQSKTDILEVDFPPDLWQKVPAEKRQALLRVLAQDPRPAYQADTERVYGFSFAGFTIRFKVNESLLTVTDVSK